MGGEILGEVKLLAGVFTMQTADEPICIDADDGLGVPSRGTTHIDAIADPKDGAIIYDSDKDEIVRYYNNQWNGFGFGAGAVGYVWTHHKSSFIAGIFRKAE